MMLSHPVSEVPSIVQMKLWSTIQMQRHGPAGACFPVNRRGHMHACTHCWYWCQLGYLLNSCTSQCCLIYSLPVLLCQVLYLLLCLTQHVLTKFDLLLPWSCLGLCFAFCLSACLYDADLFCTLSILLPAVHAWSDCLLLTRLVWPCILPCPIYSAFPDQHATYLVPAGHLPAKCLPTCLHKWSVIWQPSNCQSDICQPRVCHTCFHLLSLPSDLYLVKHQPLTCTVCWTPHRHSYLTVLLWPLSLTTSGPWAWAVWEASLFTSGSTTRYVTHPLPAASRKAELPRPDICSLQWYRTGTSWPNRAQAWYIKAGSTSLLAWML